MLSEAAIQTNSGKKEIAFFRFVAVAFATKDIMARRFVFDCRDDPSGKDHETFPKLKEIVMRSLLRAEEILPYVVEMDAGVLESFKSSGTQLAGRGAEPLIYDPKIMLRDFHELVQTYGHTENHQTHKEDDSVLEQQTVEYVPQLPVSRLTLDCFALQYHVQLLMQKLADLESQPAKEQANAIFLSFCYHTFADFLKVVSRYLELKAEMESVEQLELRNELMTVDKIAAELYLLDRLLWSRLNPENLMDTRLVAVNTVKPIMDYFNFLVNFTMSSVQKAGNKRETADTIVFLTHIAHRLIDKYGDYNASSAISLGINSDKVLGDQREAVGLLPDKIVRLIKDIQMTTGPNNKYALCKEHVYKHPNPVPNIFMALEESRQVLELPRKTAKLLDRVISNCSSSAFKSQRPDIQHWLLSRKFGVTLRNQELKSADLKPDNKKISVIPPEPNQIELDVLNRIDDDRFNIVYGIHAVDK